MASHALTALIISPSDLKRARRELEAVDDFLHQAGLRQGGKVVKLPQTSRLIDELARESGVNLLRPSERASLLKELSDLVAHAPVLHFSFASEPSAVFMTKLIGWLRTNIHPNTLVHLGLQPSIAAGCIVRTENKQFDFSLTQAFEKQRQEFVDSLKQYLQPAESPAAGTAAVAPGTATIDPIPQTTVASTTVATAKPAAAKVLEKSAA